MLVVILRHLRHLLFHDRNVETRISLFFVLTLGFTILYSFLGDHHFSGFRSVSDLIQTRLQNGGDNVFVAPVNIETKTHNTHEPGWLARRVFERFYFATTTGTTLGYGDIYPQTILARSLCTAQIMTTFCLILL